MNCDCLTTEPEFSREKTRGCMHFDSVSWSTFASLQIFPSYLGFRVNWQLDRLTRSRQIHVRRFSRASWEKSAKSNNISCGTFFLAHPNHLRHSNNLTALSRMPMPRWAGEGHQKQRDFKTIGTVEDFLKPRAEASSPAAFQLDVPPTILQLIMLGQACDRLSALFPGAPLRQSDTTIWCCLLSKSIDRQDSDQRYNRKSLQEMKVEGMWHATFTLTCTAGTFWFATGTDSQLSS